MQPANDDQINSEQSKLVVLHAQYLLALSNHRRDGLIMGFFYGALTTVCVAYFAMRYARFF